MSPKLKAAWTHELGEAGRAQANGERRHLDPDGDSRRPARVAAGLNARDGSVRARDERPPGTALSRF